LPQTTDGTFIAVQIGLLLLLLLLAKPSIHVHVEQTFHLQWRCNNNIHISVVPLPSWWINVFIKS